MTLGETRQILHHAGARLHNAHIYSMTSEELQTIEFEAKDGVYCIEDDRIQALIEGYSNKLDLKYELLKASAWLRKNRSRQREKKLVFRFLVCWLMRSLKYQKNEHKH